jgi:hypothetical protein
MPDLPIKILEEYNKKLESCREFDCHHRDFQELRRCLFTNAVMYGTHIYPDTRKFFRDVYITLLGILRINAVTEFKLMLNGLADDCKKHVKEAMRLEKLHVFAGSRFRKLADTLKQWIISLNSEVANLAAANEGWAFARLFRSLVGGGQENEDVQNERRNLELAIKGVQGLQECCSQMQNVVSCINQ